MNSRHLILSLVAIILTSPGSSAEGTREDASKSDKEIEQKKGEKYSQAIAEYKKALEKDKQTHQKLQLCHDRVMKIYNQLEPADAEAVDQLWAARHGDGSSIGTALSRAEREIRGQCLAMDWALTIPKWEPNYPKTGRTFVPDSVYTTPIYVKAIAEPEFIIPQLEEAEKLIKSYLLVKAAKEK